MKKQLYKYENIVYTREQLEKTVQVIKPLVDHLFELTPSLKNSNWSTSHGAVAGVANCVLGALKNSNKKVLYWEKMRNNADPSFSKDEKGENEFTQASRNYKWNSENSQDLTLIDQLMTHSCELVLDNLNVRKTSATKEKSAEQEVAEQKQLDAENKKLINFKI